ncbi:NAD(P)-dependent oxidoreductase [Microbulbifer sp. OS29]|uniref:dTDP-4-dehydrorhamnose reductase n=1 Tax=Microbulbifer okhotskensis TaxID=2926617 RepID=A0A9X2EP85_9GAMM|nr:sugar nucleotide-binding protein [Microbulbifer okhotskensis]MCO1334805.1 NAD(P)-dependent oxidoreductase [Microbulbifer okhotskensis]
MSELNTGYMPDTVAIITAGNEIDGALQKRLQRVGFRIQQLAPTELDQLRPGSIVINASACVDNRDMPEVLQVCAQLSGAACKHIIHLSSYQVFSGGERRRYDEDEPADPQSSSGQNWLACEAAFSGLQDLTVLRFGWMVDSAQGALLARILRGFVLGEALALDDRISGNPVTVVDMARVAVATAQQLASGAEVSGIYHYGSTDSCTAMEFALEVVERAQAFCDEERLAQFTSLEDGGEKRDRSIVLACGKLRDVFGIQQRSWRQGLTRQVELWLERLNLQAE